MLYLKEFLCIILVVFVSQIFTAVIDKEDNLIDLSHLPPKAFGLPDLKSGEKLKNWSPTDNTNPEELGTYFEGDILIQPSSGKYGLINTSYRWSSGIVPFKITGNFNITELGNIAAAIKAYTTNTCIRFISRTDEPDYVEITSDNTGCYSYVGRQTGKQILNLQAPGCVSTVGTPIHEMMHTLGFFHEHSRYDRDDYIKIVFENIQTDTKVNFAITPKTDATTYNIPYNYGSVMHYRANAFSVNGSATIIPLKPANNMGQRVGFHPDDIKEVNTMYNCPSTVTPTAWVYGFIDFLMNILHIRVSDEMIADLIATE